MANYDGSIKIDTKLDSKGLQDGLGKLGGVAKGALKGTAVAIGAVSTALVGAGGLVAKLGMDFEAKMSGVQAVAGATADELNMLKEQAKQLGADTAFSASEAAEGMENLASAGFSTSEIMAAMPGMLDMAAASGEALALSSEIAASTLRGFGLAAEDAGHVADVLAKNAMQTNAAVADTGEAMKYIAPIAKNAGWSMESVTAAIGSMADANIKGSQAGTTLRSVLTSLIRPSKKSADAMEAMGFSAYDAQGKMKPITTIIQDLGKATKNMTAEQRDYAIASIFGTEALSGMQVLIDAGPEKLDAMTESLINSTGAAKEAAEIRLDNLKGQVEALRGSLETLGLSLYEGVNNPLKDVVKSANGMVDQLAEAFSKGSFEGLVSALGDVLAQVITGIAEYAPTIIESAISLIQAFIGGIQNNLPQIVQSGMQALTALITGILQMLPQIIQLGLDLIVQLALGISQALPTLIPAIIDTIFTIVDTLLNNIDLLIDAGIELMLALLDGIIDAIPRIVEKLPKIVIKIVEALVRNYPKMLSAGTQLIAGLFEGMWTLFKSSYSAMGNTFYNYVIVPIKNKLGEMIEVGKNIVEGIWNGISNSWTWLTAKISEWCGNILENVKSFFGIKSPSRVMRDEVGNMLVEGIAVGIKDNKYKVSEEFKKLLADLELQRDLDIINDAEYYAQLENLRDKYLKKGTEDWWKYTKEIMGYEKDLVEQQKKDIVGLYTDIATEAGKRIEDVLKLQEKMTDKLKDYGKLYDNVRITGGGKTEEFMQLRDISKDIKDLEAYKNAIMAVKERGAPQEFMSILKDMDVEEGTQFANTLLNSSDSDFDRYIFDWQKKQETAAEISKELYQDETDEMIKYLTDELEKAGLEVPEGFFDNGKTAAENFGKGFLEKLDTVMQNIKEAVTISMANIMPSISYAGGIPSMSSVTNSYSSTYQLVPSGETTSQQLETIRNAETVNKLRGGD